MMRRRILWSVLCVAALVACDQATDPAAPAVVRAWGPWRDVGSTLDGEGVRFRAAPWPIPVGKPFAMEVEVSNHRAIPGSPEEVTMVVVDGTMPHHGHGMNFRPPRSRGERNDRTLAAVLEGLLFHMQGRWQVTVDLERRSGVVDRVSWVEEVQP